MQIKLQEINFIIFGIDFAYTLHTFCTPRYDSLSIHYIVKVIASELNLKFSFENEGILQDLDQMNGKSVEQLEYFLLTEIQ